MNNKIEYEYLNGACTRAKAEIEVVRGNTTKIETVWFQIEKAQILNQEGGHQWTEVVNCFGVHSDFSPAQWWEWYLAPRSICAATWPDCCALLQMVVRHGLIYDKDDEAFRIRTPDEVIEAERRKQSNSGNSQEGTEQC